MFVSVHVGVMYVLASFCTRYYTYLQYNYSAMNKDCLAEVTEEVIVDIAPDVNEQCRTRVDPHSKYCLHSSVQKVQIQMHIDKCTHTNIRRKV